ncbi:MAG: universal stress protein [Deltaproteobacteria bacterium]|nr:universal stress protein [Deltaproteobacteria bacterium]
MYKKILVAYDGSQGADRALEAGIELAKLHGAVLTALAVEERLPHFSGTIDEVQEEKEFANHQFSRLLEKARSRARGAGVELQTYLRAGHAAKTIIEVAQKGKFDLLLLGASGLSGIWRFMGTTAEKVSRHAPCSVLIVR